MSSPRAATAAHRAGPQRRAASRAVRRWRSAVGPRSSATRAGHPAVVPSGSIRWAASASRRRATSWSGWTVRTSAAPRAAKPIARVQGDRLAALTPKQPRAPRRRAAANRAAAVPEPPERPTPAVGDARLVLPGQVGAETVAETAVGALGAREEALVGRGQRGRGLVRLGFAGGDHQPPRHVVDAVPVFQSSLGELGVLEETGRVAEPSEVGEGDAGAGHALTRIRSASRAEDARSRYCCATALHSSCGRDPRASAAMAAASPGSVSTLLRAAAIASGF